MVNRHNEVYSWQNINCSVHNVIIGKIWIEHVRQAFKHMYLTVNILP